MLCLLQRILFTAHDLSLMSSLRVVCNRINGRARDPTRINGRARIESSNLKVLSCLFSAYHALKGDIRAGTIHMH